MRHVFISKDKSVLTEKVKEAFSSVIPIVLIVVVLCFTLIPIESGIMLAFLLGALLVVLGMGLFTLGADVAMSPIGSYVGNTVVKSKKIWLIIPAFFLIGILITISEPDLAVLAEQLKAVINQWQLILFVGIGVGVFLVFAFLRIILKIKLSYILIGSYVVTFILSFFVPEEFVPLAFDSGGVTTGPMSVPFILAIGVGVSNLRSDKNADDDGFGLTALCSIGPIISVMILGLIYRPDNFEIEVSKIPEILNSKDLIVSFGQELPSYLLEVFIALLPIILFFLVCLIFGYKIERLKFRRILVGLLYTYVGLVLFLLGANCGFMPVGMFVGKQIGELPYNYVIIPIGMVLGYFIVSAEPAVHVLKKQVFDITEGAIPKRALSVTLAIGVAFSVGFAFLRILLNVPIMWFLIPAYAIAIILTFLVPEIFTAIAFDSGGVASGAMTSSFILPMSIGLSSVVGGNVAVNGFGIVAFVAMTPLIAIQILGLIYKIKLKKLKKKEEEILNKEEIIG